MMVRSVLALAAGILACTCLALAQPVTVKLPGGGTQTTETTSATAGETRTTSTYTGTRDSGDHLKSEVTRRSAINEPAGSLASTTDTVQTRTYHVDGSSTVVTVATSHNPGHITVVDTETAELDKQGVIKDRKRSYLETRPGKRDYTYHENLSIGGDFRPLVKPPPGPIVAPPTPPGPRSQIGIQRSIILGYINEIKARLKALTADYHPGNTTLLKACKDDGVQAGGQTRACGGDFFLQFDHVTPYYTEHIGRLTTVLSVLRHNSILEAGYVTPQEMSYFANGMRSWRAGDATIVAAFAADVKSRVQYAHLQDQYDDTFAAYRKSADEDPASEATKAAQSRWYVALDRVNAWKATNDYVAAGRYRAFSGLVPYTSRKGQQLQPIAAPMTRMPQLKPI